jgi:hypothetical protein
MNEHPTVKIGRREASIWWIASFLLLSLLFSTAILKNNALPAWAADYPTQPVNTHPYFDAVSEVLVMNPVDQALAGIPNEKGFLFYVQPDPRVLDVNDLKKFQPEWVPGTTDLSRPDWYRSQIGIQAHVYAATARSLALPRDQTFDLLWTFSALMLAAMLGVLIRFIYLLWGREAAGAALAFAALSTGFNLFSWSLYWVSYLDVAPTAMATVLALRLPSRSRVTTMLLFGLVALLLMLSLANGYEFMTTTISATAVPFFMVYAAGRISLKSAIGYAFTAVGIGIACFVTVLAVHYSIYVDAFGDTFSTWAADRNERWGWAGLAAYGVVDLVKALVINAFDIGGFGIPNALLLALGGLFVLIALRGLFTRRLEDERTRVTIAVSAAMLSSLSWLMLQFPHIAFHPRFSSFIISFPFGLFLFAGLGRLWALRAQRRAGIGSGERAALAS